MHRLFPLMFAVLCGLLCCPPSALSAQAAVHPSDPRPFSRRISALRLQAMLRPSGGVPPLADRTPIASSNSIGLTPAPAIRLAGRTIQVPLSGPLDLRAGISWWTTGIRTSAGMVLRF